MPKISISSEILMVEEITVYRDPLTDGEKTLYSAKIAFSIQLNFPECGLTKTCSAPISLDLIDGKIVTVSKQGPPPFYLH